MMQQALSGSTLERAWSDGLHPGAALARWSCRPALWTSPTPYAELGRPSWYVGPDRVARVDSGERHLLPPGAHRGCVLGVRRA